MKTPSKVALKAHPQVIADGQRQFSQNSWCNPNVTTIRLTLHLHVQRCRGQPHQFSANSIWTSGQAVVSIEWSSPQVKHRQSLKFPATPGPVLSHTSFQLHIAAFFSVLSIQLSGCCDCDASTAAPLALLSSNKTRFPNRNVNHPYVIGYLCSNRSLSSPIPLDSVKHSSTRQLCRCSN